LHEVVRVGIIGAPTVSKYGKGVVLQLLEIDLPLLIFQTDDNPEISLPHSLDRFGHQLSVLVVGGRSGPGNVAEKSRGCRRFGKSGVEGLSQDFSATFPGPLRPPTFGLRRWWPKRSRE